MIMINKHNKRKILYLILVLCFKRFQRKINIKIVININIYLLLINFYYSCKIRFYDRN